MKLSPKKFLETELNAGISADNPAFRELAKRTINQLIDYDITTVMDYGAGTGVYSNAAQEAGYDTYAFEIWQEHRDYIKAKFPKVKHIIRPVTTDAMLFIEVAEHMTDIELHKLMNRIKPDVILFSSTPHHNPGFDEEWGHINIKQPEQWDRFFDEYAYKIDRLVKLPTEWARIYTKIF